MDNLLVMLLADGILAADRLFQRRPQSASADPDELLEDPEGSPPVNEVPR
jgi:hypothetical protein